MKIKPLLSSGVFALLLVSGLAACGQPEHTTTSPAASHPTTVRGGDELQRWEIRLGIQPESDELQRWEAKLPRS